MPTINKLASSLTPKPTEPQQLRQIRLLLPHYVVAVGYDQDNIYFMDPATIGNYTYFPIPEFLERWHDQDRPRQKLYNFGMVIDGKPPAYDPDEIKRMNCGRGRGRGNGALTAGSLAARRTAKGGYSTFFL